jgi:ABC-2 type transport system ATP-binding protein
VDNLLTAEENLPLMADLHHLDRREGRRRAAELLAQFDLVAAGKGDSSELLWGISRRLDLPMNCGKSTSIAVPHPCRGKQATACSGISAMRVVLAGPANSVWRSPIRELSAHRGTVEGSRTEASHMLHVSGLEKSYGDVLALRGVDLDVAAGEIVALLGPNGAGKTTLVSIVAGLRKADAGIVEVDGLDALSRSTRVRQRIGLAPQETGIYPVVSVRNNLMLFGELAGMGRSQLRRSVDEVAAALDITDLLDRQAGKLSGGQKRRLHTAIALLHKPRLLLLDEATTGADVETRGHILELVQRLAADGSAVLYSTHYLAEVETIGSDVAILDEGKVIARGGVTELISAHAVAVVELAFDGAVPAIWMDHRATVEGNRLRVPTRDPAATLVDVMPRIPRGTLSTVEIIRPNLEAVYLALTGRRYQEADREPASEDDAAQKGQSRVGSQ